jgi:alkylation response protein AidB-like acyl-CoA dehydrogenase
MDFEFTEEQTMLRDNVRSMLEAHWPVSRARYSAENDDIAADLRQIGQHINDAGLPMILVPEAHGGLGLSFLDFVLVAEEFGRALVPGLFTQTILLADVVARYGTPPQKEAILPRIASGEATAAFGWLENGSGFSAESITTSLSDEGHDSYRLNGRKVLVPYASSADLLFVTARMADGALGVVVCDRTAKGVTLEQHVLLDPTSRAHAVTFESVQVAKTSLLGNGLNSGNAIERAINLSAAASATEMVGCGSVLLDMAVTYAKQRQQFGKIIGSFQAIKHKCADMYVALETSRSAAYYAAYALSSNDVSPHSPVSMAKAYSGDAFRLIGNDSLQIHGGIGFTWQLDLHLFLKRGKYLQCSFGDARWHRERALSAALSSMKLPSSPDFHVAKEA